MVTALLCFISFSNSNCHPFSWRKLFYRPSCYV